MAAMCPAGVPARRMLFGRTRLRESIGPPVCRSGGSSWAAKPPACQRQWHAACMNRKSKLPATALPHSKQRNARLAHGLRKCSGKQCGQPDEERYASRRGYARVHAARCGTGGGYRSCLKTPLRFVSKACPCAAALLQLALQGAPAAGNRQADRALSKPAQAPA